MPPRTTLGDRARKARIREREYRHEIQKFKKLESITTKQVNLLKKIGDAETAGAPLTTADVADWRVLRSMGVVREKVQKPNRLVILTALGTQVLVDKGK